MLKSLDYAVEFPTTGRSFQNRIDFAPGLTAITGRNEAGKTIVFEMVGYCCFGKAALRGLASDYRKLSACLELDIGGSAWVLDRQPKSESFTIDGEVVAVGAEAINKEVPKRLGFGIDVWNIALAAQQGDLGALTEMRPTARREMIDRLIGIDLLEDIEKQCKVEGKTQETVAASLALSLPAPQEPVCPPDYQLSEELLQISDTIRGQEAERLSLIQIQEPAAPVEPVAVDGSVEDLEHYEARRQDVLREQAQLQGHLAGMPEPRFSRSDLEKALAYQAHQAEVNRRGPRPDHSKEQLLEWDNIYQQKALIKGDTVVCPECDHEFAPGSPDVDVNHIHLLVDPPISQRDITTQMRRHELWAEPIESVGEFTIPDLQKEILAHANAADRVGVLSRLNDLDVPVDRSGELRAVRAYQQELALYRERYDRYGEQMAVYREAQSRLEGLVDQSERLAGIQLQIANARHYEAALERYHLDQARYTDVMGRATTARDLAGGYGRGAVSLKNARQRVKQELAPSLSLAASTLITAMTNGERRNVDVDHDLNITVDGQPLQTLSGSGKSVVNLALRIGLGQVLTSKVLPIFMGDEIDKDMDQQRAGATHETLQSLRQHLTQIILVTHKEIEADHIIQL